MIVPFLYFTCGLPGSGKSTFTERLEKAQIAKVVSRDQIRNLFGSFNKHKEARVVEMCRLLIQGHLLNNTTVVFDSTALSVKDRMRIMSWINEPYILGHMIHKPAAACLHLVCDLETSIRRREKTIPSDKLVEMRSFYRIPKPEEGFEVVTIRDAIRDPLPGSERARVAPEEKDAPTAA